jgi:DNA mismatch repair ATPase MutS
MQEFNRLVAKQMQTMDRLLFLQSELERCQEIEDVLKELQHESQVASVQLEIIKMKKELKDIQQQFELQTEEVIRSYQEIGVTTG